HGSSTSSVRRGLASPDGRPRRAARSRHAAAAREARQSRKAPLGDAKQQLPVVEMPPTAVQASAPSTEHSRAGQSASVAQKSAGSSPHTPPAQLPFTGV